MILGLILGAVGAATGAFVGGPNNRFKGALIGGVIGGSGGLFIDSSEGGGSDHFVGADRLYDRALPEVGKRRALDQVRGYLLVPDDRTTNAEFTAWRRHRGV